MVATVLEVPLDPGDGERLADLAKITGRTEAEIAAEAIHDLLLLNEQQVAEISDAILSIDQGKGVPHREVEKWAESLLTDSPPPSPGRRHG